MPKVVLRDHYVVLGVERNATLAEIKDQYRKRAREVHPDLLGPDAPKADILEATELFAELSVAYEQLSNPALRELIDQSLGSPGPTSSSGFEEDYAQPTYRKPVEVPKPGNRLLNGIWCWVEYRVSGWYHNLKAVVTVQLADIFRAVDIGSLPDGGWVEEIIAVDEKGDVVGRGYSLASLRYEVRRLQAEAQRNVKRRAWSLQLEGFERNLKDLAEQNRPVGRLRALLFEARNYVGSGSQSLRYAEHPDTVTRAIREVEKEIERVTASDATELLLADLLVGKLAHPDLRYNEALLQKLRVYEFRSGGAYSAPTPEAVEAHYQQRLAGLTTQDQVHCTSLRLPNDEPTILELVQDGAIELAPDVLNVQGSKSLAPYDVSYGYARVDGKLVPVGIITVPESIYKMNGAQYGRASRFPTLPHGITLLIRVWVKVQDSKMLSDPHPDGKPLMNEVARCQQRLRNPKEPEVSYGTSVFLVPRPF